MRSAVRMQGMSHRGTVGPRDSRIGELAMGLSAQQLRQQCVGVHVIWQVISMDIDCN